MNGWGNGQEQFSLLKDPYHQKRDWDNRTGYLDNHTDFYNFDIAFRYCDIDTQGNKALVMKQYLEDEKVEEIGEIIEMKITHRKNLERRKAKFGYDSFHMIFVQFYMFSI